MRLAVRMGESGPTAANDLGFRWTSVGPEEVEIRDHYYGEMIDTARMLREAAVDRPLIHSPEARASIVVKLTISASSARRRAAWRAAHSGTGARSPGRPIRMLAVSDFSGFSQGRGHCGDRFTRAGHGWPTHNRH